MTKMARLNIIFCLILVLFLASCDSSSNCTEVSGSVITEERSLEAFSIIESRGSFEINFFEEEDIETPLVSITAPENIISSIETSIVGESLILESDECFETESPITVNIFSPNISEMLLRGSGNINLQTDITSPSFTANVEGSGRILLTEEQDSIRSQNITALINGSGEIYLRVLNSSKTTVLVSGSGNVRLSGDTNQTSLHVNGSGNIFSFDLISESSNAEVISSGKIELTATDTLSARLSGSGNILVKGNPGIKADITGSGKVERVD